MPNELDEYFDRFAPTSRDNLAAKRATQQAQADAEGVSLATIEFREREAAKASERDAEQHRNAAAAMALSAAQAALPSLEGFPPLARQAMQRELLRREVERQREEAEELAQDPNGRSVSRSSVVWPGRTPGSGSMACGRASKSWRTGVSWTPRCSTGGTPKRSGRGGQQSWRSRTMARGTRATATSRDRAPSSHP